MKNRLTPTEKALLGLKEMFGDFENDPDITQVRWTEIMYKYVSSSPADFKHATSMLLERGVISLKAQGGYILHIDMLNSMIN